MKRFLIISSLILSASFAAPIPVSKAMFKSKEFAKSFAGSYGILSPVEPKVSRGESEILSEIAEFFEQGQFSSAEGKLVSYIKEKQNPVDGSEPSEVSAAMIFVLGNLYFQNDRAQDAIRSYKLAIDRFPKFRRAYKNLALLYASKDDYTSALPYLKQAVQLGDADHKTYGLLGYCYLSTEKPLAAEGAYRQAYLLNPDERDWKLGLAQALLGQEKWTEGAALLGELIDENPDNAQLWMQQANCFLGKEENLRAAYNYEVLRRKGLADGETLNLLGNIYMDQSKPELALKAYEESLRISSTPNVDSALNTAKVLVDFGAEDQAKRFLSKIDGFTLNKNQKVRSLLIRKEIAYSNGQTKEVEKYLNSAKEIDPANGNVLVQLGRFYSDQAKAAETEEAKTDFFLKAKTQYKLALEKPEVSFDANLRYGQMLVSQRRFTDALTFLNKALSMKPTDNLKQYIRRVERAAERESKKS